MPRKKSHEPFATLRADEFTAHESPPPFVVYDDNTCADLAEKYDLANHVTAMQDALIEAGEAYLRHGPPGYQPLEPPRNERELLEDVLHDASRLSGSLSHFMLQPLPGILKKIEFGHRNSDLEVSFEGTRSFIKFGESRGIDGKWHSVSNDVSATRYVSRLISALATAVRDIHENLAPDQRPSKRGRPRQRGVEVFVARIAKFWVKATGKPFTVNYTVRKKGKGAVPFAVEALALLDNVPETMVISAARQVRKSRSVDKKSPRAR